MAKYNCSPSEKYAIYTVHGERCYLCRRPIDLDAMQVDHVIPESLLCDSDALNAALASLGRTAEFNLNSFANWMPSCVPCNIKKSDAVFDPSLLVQTSLQQAARLADRAAALASEVVSNQQVSKLLNLLMRKHEQNDLPQSTIEKLAIFHMQHRNQESAATPIRLSEDHAIALMIRFSGGPRDGETVASGGDELEPDAAKLLLGSTAGIAQWVDAGLATPGRFFTWKQPNKYLVELGKKKSWSEEEFKARMKYDLYDVNSHEWGESILILKAEYEGME
jgi:hypothetical protein